MIFTNEICFVNDYGFLDEKALMDNQETLLSLLSQFCYLWEPLYSFWDINVNVQFQFTKALLQKSVKRMHCPLNIHLAMNNKLYK